MIEINDKKIKVLFLDLDGVINCSTTNFKTDLWPIDRYKAFLVGKIVLDTDCKVVLSSSWRYHPEGVNAVEKHIVPVFGITPLFKAGELTFLDQKERGHEIKAWLDKHPEVTKYAIVDDDADMLSEQIPSLFQTSWETGLTEKIAEDIIRFLNE